MESQGHRGTDRDRRGKEASRGTDRSPDKRGLSRGAEGKERVEAGQAGGAGGRQLGQEGLPDRTARPDGGRTLAKTWTPTGPDPGSNHQETWGMKKVVTGL